jgi:hypothetical protein
MRNVLLSVGVTSHHWVQHNLPWLAVLAIVLGLGRDDTDDGLPGRGS